MIPDHQPRILDTTRGENYGYGEHDDEETDDNSSDSDNTNANHANNVTT